MLADGRQPPYTGSVLLELEVAIARGVGRLSRLARAGGGTTLPGKLLAAVDAMNISSVPALLWLFPRLKDLYAELPERLGGERYEEAEAAGRRLSFDEALALAREMVAGMAATSQPAPS